MFIFPCTVFVLLNFRFQIHSSFPNLRSSFLTIFYFSCRFCVWTPSFHVLTIQVAEVEKITYHSLWRVFLAVRGSATFDGTSMVIIDYSASGTSDQSVFFVPHFGALVTWLLINTPPAFSFDKYIHMSKISMKENGINSRSLCVVYLILRVAQNLC